MLSLKDLNCAIELSESQQALREFGTIYGDGFVETFIPVPSEPQSFSIHLTSNKFIAPGVAIFVYVDGVYQCNRNRQDLKLRKPSDSRSLVDFRVRQKEERQSDGSMIAREWAFGKVNIASANDAPNLCSPNILENIGCIEVVVLRCAGTRNAKSASTMNFDGAGDYPDRRFDLDDTSSPSNERSMYDDRGPFFTSSGNGHGPPPPISSYRSPYAESLRSQERSASRSRRTTHTPHNLFPPVPIVHRLGPRSRYSEPVSPGAQRISDLPAPGFQYGSGPIPRDRETYKNHPLNVGATQPPAMDPIWLNNLLTTAVKQGVEESRRMDVQSRGQARYKEKTFDAPTTSQPPGAWPESPFGAPTLPHQQSEQPSFSLRDHQSDHGSNWKQSQSGWSERPSRSRVGTHVTWNNEPEEETASSSVGGWNSRGETPSDSWDTGDTWPTDRIAEWEASSQQGKSWLPDAPSHYNAKPSSSVTPRTRDRARSKHESRGKPRSKSQSRHSRRKHNVASSEEKGSWAYLDRPSDSVVSLSSSDDTLQPSHSRSRVQTPRSRSKSLSRPSKSSLRECGQKSSKHSHRTPTWGPTDTIPVPAPPVITRLTPTVMNAPIPVIPIQEWPRQPSAGFVPPASVLPPLEWAFQVQDAMRKPSIATSTVAPAPYAQSLKDFVQSTAGEMRGGHRSSSSSSWGDDKKDGAVQVSWAKETQENTGWDKNSDGGWQDKMPKENGTKGWYSTDDDETGGWTKDGDDKKAEAAEAWNWNESGWGTKPVIPIEKQNDKTNDIANLKSALKAVFENPPAPDVPWQNQSLTLPPAASAPKPNMHHHHAPPTPCASAPVPAPPSPEQSKRMSNKSLSQYRPNNHPSLTTLSTSKPKPHWQFPPPLSTPTHLLSPEDTYIAPAEPRLIISQETASSKGIEYAVRPGRATRYGHVVGRPEYLDGLDRPYAVFRFKYRSAGVLKGLFGDEVGGDGKDAGGKKDKDKERRMSERMVDGVARNLTKRWVERHSRDQSVVAKSLGREKTKRRENGKKEKEKEKEASGMLRQGGVDDGWWAGGDVKW